MSDLVTQNIPILDYVVGNNLTFFDPHQASLSLQVLDLSMIQTEGEILECNLTLQADPEIYQRIDADALFNLNPEFRIPISHQILVPEQNVILHLSLQPELFSQLATKVTDLEELSSFLQHLSQNEPSSSFLSTENWLGLSVTQGLEPDIYGYRTIWTYIKPSDMSEEALSNGRMTEVMNQFVEEQIKTNLSKISLGENSEIQSEVIEFVKQLINQQLPPQAKQNLPKSKKQKKSKKSNNLFSNVLSQELSSDFQAEITGLINQLDDINVSLDDEAETPSPQLLEALVDFFQRDNWDFVQTEGEPVLRSMFQGENGQWACYAWSLEEKHRIAFYSVCPVNVPENRRYSLAELLTRCNYCLLMGNFEMDFSDGEIRFKTSIDVNGDRITFALLRQLIYTNVLTMDQYLPAIMSVIYGNATPEQAIAKIESAI